MSGLKILPSWLPYGNTLPDDIWRRRHRVLLWLLWAHVALIPPFALLEGFSLGHGLLEGSILAGPALIGTLARGRRLQSAFVSIGLLTASALLVHLTGGVIEAHFHFFVMILVLTVYEDWLPLGLAIGFVLLHHGVVGTLDATSVYGHKAAQQDPWKWALIHAGFVAAAAVAGVTGWRMQEQLRDAASASERRSRQAADELARAQSLYRNLIERAPAITYVAEPGPSGAWTYVSPYVERLLGYTPEEWQRDPDLWLSRIEPEDRDRVVSAEHEAAASGQPLAIEYRIRSRNGELLWFRDEAILKGAADGNTYAEGLMVDITERKRMEERLRDLATHDQMTGLLNRHHFEELVGRQLSLDDRYGHPGGALLALDLDKFKEVNDTFGHQAGDEVLIAVASVLKERLRDSDIVGRLGGDEFGAYLPEIANEEAAMVAGDLIKALRERPVVLGPAKIRPVVSIGIACASSHPESNVDELMAAADAEMYRAKRGRRTADSGATAA